MKKNIGKIDRAIRLLMSVATIITVFVIPITGVWALVLLSSAVFLLISAILSWCPMCAITGRSTCEIQ